MKAVVDRVVQYPHRYQLKNVNTGEVLGTFDLEPITGTISVVGTKIDKELFDSIASDISARLVSNGGDAKDNVITYTMASNRSNIASGEKLSVSFGKIAKYFNDLKAVAFSGNKADIGLGNVDNTSDANKPVSNATQQALNNKANSSDVYTKTETDGLLNNKANTNDVYSKTKTDELLNNKANKSDVYTKSETDGLLNNKANKTETDNKINKSLYNLGAYDTISGNVITRQTGYVDLGSLSWSEVDTNCWKSVVSNFPNIYTSGKVIVGEKYKSASITDYAGFIALGVGYIGMLSTYEYIICMSNGKPTGLAQYKLATPYTEEIIEGQPLITLDQQGSQWLRNEWGKGLNLLDYNSRIVNKAINSSGQIIDYNGAYYIKVSLKPNTTYNASGCTDSTSGSVSLFTSNGTFIRKIESSNLDSKGNFITDSNVSYALCDNLADRTQPMLVEGDHPYPYQAYNGEIVHDKNIADLYKQEYNLGYYDTMVDNSDGTYTITRQTGYYNISNDLIEHGYYRTTQGGHGEYGGDTGIHNFPIVSEQKSFINNLLAVRDTGEVYRGLIGIAITRDGGCWMNLGDNYTSKEQYVEYLSKNNIYIQYKLATSYTEKVEKNHYARYNQRFILDHNKSEAERSCNLFSGGVSLMDKGLVVGKQYIITTKNNTIYNFKIATQSGATPGSADLLNNQDNTSTFIFTWNTNKNWNLYVWTTDWVSQNNDDIEIMLNEGTEPLPYQAYEGKVVHEKELEAITPGIFTKLGNKTNFSFDSGSYLVVANNGMVTVTGEDPLNVGSSANKKYLGVFMVTIAEYDGGQSLRVNTEQVFFADYVSGTISGSRFTIYKLN